jgi:fucose 4-O-acetylase-like acetyltransferase
MKAEKYTIKNTAGMFNLVKGLAMFIVIFGHTYTLFPDFFINHAITDSGRALFSNFSLGEAIILMLYIIAYCISMPSLLIIGGYGSRKTTFKKNLSKQFKSLMVPYIITMFITSALHLCSHYFLYRYFPGSVKETLKIFAGSLLGLSKTTYFGDVEIFSNGPNWFLMTLFVSMIIFNTLVSYFDKTKLLIAVLLVSTAGWLLSLVNTVPFCLSQGLISVAYIYMGYYAKKNKLFTEGINTRKKAVCFILIVVSFMIIKILGYVDKMAGSVYPLSMFSILLDGLFALCIIYLFLFLNRFNGFITSFIRNVGQYSIYVLCIHTIEMLGFPLYHFAEKWKGGPVSGTMLFCLIRAAVDISICFLFVKVKDFVLVKVSKKEETTDNV